MKSAFPKWASPVVLLAFLLFGPNGFSQNNCFNILTNGDFEAGNTGFTSGLPLNCGCFANSYCVNMNFNQKCSGWPSLTDHTTSSGKFLIIDGNLNAPADVWRNTVNLTQGGTYCFSFWAATVYLEPFNLELRVDGIVLTTFALGAGPSWVQNSFNIPLSSGSHTLSLRQETGGATQDFGLDDIVFGLPLIPDFVSNPDIACGTNVQFFTQSTGPGPLTYLWTFGDPNSGPANSTTQQNPTHKFTTCGDFEVCLTVSRGSCVEKICKTITVTDDEPPVAKCNPGLGVTLDANCQYLVTTAFVNDNSTDNCMIQSLSVSPTVLTGCATHTVTLTVTDKCDNTSTCTMGIQTIEAVPPVIACPQNIAIKCDQQLPPFFTGTATATDNCTATSLITITHTDVTTGNIPCNATVTRTWTAEDACKNTSQCTQVITVRDDVPPTISCPPGLSVNTLPGACYYTFFNFQQLGVTAADNCDPLPTIIATWEDPNGTILPYTPQTQLPKGVNTIRCFARDQCGNVSATCTFKVTVTDNEIPMLTCPLSISVVGAINPQGLCKAVVNGIGATASDNCPMLAVAYAISAPTGGTGNGDASGTMFMQGTSTLTYTATDMAGNKTTCSFTVTVNCPNSCDCCPAGNTPGPDLLSNGQFTAGDDGSFISITAACNTCTANRRCVGNEFRSKCNSWPDDFWDNTVGTAAGSFLIIDGPESGPAVNVWSNSTANTINVTAGTIYSFSFWVASIYSEQFQLGMMVNGTNVNTVTINQATPQWTRYCTNWTAPASGTVTLAIQLLTSGLRRDFGLDDICFHACKPPCTTAITANPGLTICEGQTTTLSATGGPWANCQWSNSVSGSSIVVSAPGTYCVTCTSASGCTATACATVVVIPVSLLSGLIGYFPFNGLTNADDVSTTNIDGTLFNIASAASLNNPASAYNFNGTTSYINATTNTRGVTDKVSVVAWVKTTETQRGMWVAGQYVGGSTPKGYLLSIGEVNNAGIGQSSFSGRVDQSAYSGAIAPPTMKVNDGQWHCIVGTAGNDIWSIYVNGTLASAVTGPTLGGIASSAKSLTIGTHSDQSIGQMWFNGDMDDVRVYNRVLNECEVEAVCAKNFPSGITDFEQTASIRIYPNPNPGLFTVELPQPAVSGMTFRVTDLAGRLVLQKQTEAGSQQQTVQAGDLPDGLYFLQVVQDGRVLAVEKFVKQR